MSLPAADQLPPLLSRLSEEERVQLVDFAGHGLWIYVPSSDTLEWSQRAVELLGYRRAVQDRASLEDLVHPEDRKRRDESIQRTLADGSPYRLEVRLRRADGRYRWYLATGTVLPARADQDRRVVGFLADISDRVRVEAERDRWQTLFRAFMDHCPAAVYLKDGDSRSLYANQVAADLTGVPVEESLGKTPQEILPEDIAAQLLAADQRVLLEHRSTSNEVVFDTPDGERRHVVDLKFPVPGAADNETLVGGFGLDITERVERERELRALDQRIQATQRLESIGMLAGGIAHDFNNMLLTIRGNVELALNGSLSRDQSEMLTDALTRCDDAATLCRQLLIYSGHEKAQRQLVASSKVLDKSGALLDMVRTHGASLHLEVAPSAPSAELDLDQLQQVVWNLTKNAAESITGMIGGAIRIRCDGSEVPSAHAVQHSRIEDRSLENRYLRITVTDNGAGMTTPIAQRAFEPFFSTREEHHGLGLATVLGIVKCHRGSIGVTSAPGRGTTVEICIPAASLTVEAESPTASGSATEPEEPARSTPQTERAPATSRFADRTVLVVDDQPMVLETAARLVRFLGASVQTADSLASAMVLAEQNPDAIDLALVDITMPGGSGIELATALREQWPHLPVILMSGYVELEVDPPKELPFLAKPFDLVRLEEAMAKGSISEAERSRSAQPARSERASRQSSSIRLGARRTFAVVPGNNAGRGPRSAFVT